MRKRNLYFAAALLFFIWENIATIRWASQFDSIGAALSHTYTAITGDWMTMLIMQDGGVFVVLVIAWLLADTRARGLSSRQRGAWLFLTLALGSPAVLVYLGQRSSRTMDHPTNGAS